MLTRLARVFSSFQRHDVKYVVIGGIAAVLHGVPRATYDLDILIEATRENAERLLAALTEAGFGTAALTNADELLAHQITIFKDYVRLDVQTATKGILFESVWRRRESMNLRGCPIEVLSREDLIASKRASGREVDLRDVEALERDPNSSQT